MEGCGVCLLYLRMEASGRLCECDNVSLASVGTGTLFIIYQGWFSSLKLICWVIFCQILSFSATELSSQKCFCHDLLSGIDIWHCFRTVHADSCFSNNPVWYNSFFFFCISSLSVFKDSSKFWRYYGCTLRGSALWENCLLLCEVCIGIFDFMIHDV